MWDNVLTKKFQHRVVRGQIILKDCPFCGNAKYNIEISIEKEVFHCWICDRAGTIRKFFSEVGIPFEDDGLKVSSLPKVIKDDELSLSGYTPVQWEIHGKFLASRGLDKEDIMKYNILTTDKGKFRNKIIFPLYEDGKLVYIVARDSVPKGRYYNININRSNILPYFPGALNKTTVYLCEGIMDALSINKLGYTSAVLLGTILSQAQLKKIEAKGFLHIVVCLDGDALEKAMKIHDMTIRRGFDTQLVFMDKKDDPNAIFVRDKAELKHALKNSRNVRLTDRVNLKMKCT